MPDEMNEESVLRLVRSCSERRDWETALRALTGAARRFPASMRVLVQLGIVLEWMGKGPQARSAYSQALDGRKAPPEQSGDSDHYYRFTALLRLERFEDAWRLDQRRWEDAAFNLILTDPGAQGGPVAPLPKDFHAETLAALDRAESRPWIVFYRVLFLRALKRAPEALAAAAAAKTELGWMRYAAGEIYLRTGRCAEAEAELRASLGGERRPWYARCLLAEALLCLGREAEALRLLEEPLGGLEGPAAAEALAWKGELLLWTGRREPARTVLAEAARDNSRFADGWLAAACLLAGDLAASEEAFARIPPHRLDAETLTWRSELRWRLGRREDAVLDAEEALRKVPDMYWARLLLVLLGKGALPPGGLPAALVSFLERGTVEEALKRAKGLRRPEPYLFPLLERSLTSGS